ncbi:MULTISPECIES: ribonuclease E inhibitor RraB [Pseudomonas]|uniref:Ribonuclease E inhibitor RraB n=1 Tax=Pseudomonas putida TaxID=303 RepID=A0AAD0PCW3_PSEPU|nr:MULTISPECIES: ribonuclease E inhibitor RraB [Pseudomonas]ANC04416.1 superfamily II DNA/RNA helicase, SNF2 family protein [Pseudomonas putida]AXA26149.1 ribonuclease E inhibitor RraB [Pseudomonas putida]OCT25858.1 superfamily II DNA/RNA helicase, SNF2 family protein [Pseudomonas putida]OCT27781.1 superfamily II DNA/RNA helicase, SNF2 family protein [Pseudomonas putida]OCT32280.1 superfamily II DNA/RNA helicase, SNF2 family protein [Pseudomonas putida]
MSSQNEDISSSVLRQMKAGGFDFTQIHPIEFYATFPDEVGARRAAGQFRGESINAQVHERDDGAWHLELSKVMYATYRGIGAFEEAFEAVISPLGGEVEGWGVKQERLIA